MRAAGTAAVLAVLVAGMTAHLAAMPASELRAPSRRFTFRFAPGDGATWIETEKQTKMTQTGRLLRRVITQEARTRVTAHRTPTGWRLDHRVLSVKLKRDGHDASELISGLVGVELSLETDARGVLKRVVGLDGVVKALGRGLPAIAGFAVEAFADPSRIEAQIREEWTDRVSYFSGMHAQIGQIWVGTGKLGTVHGPVPYHAVTRVTERLSYRGVSCVRLRFVSHVDPAALAKISPEAAEKARAEAAPQVGPRRVEFSSEGERILDPSTMQLMRERIFKTTRVWVDVPLVGRTPVVNEENSETTWSYR